MPLSKLAHYSIRTSDLERSRHFYTRILGLREGFRPPFDFPGIWLYLGPDESEYGVVHIIGIDPNDPSAVTAYLGDKELPATGSLRIDAFRPRYTQDRGFPPADGARVHAAPGHRSGKRRCLERLFIAADCNTESGALESWGKTVGRRRFRQVPDNFL
jgi:catechol 2,3-dioxygenase-like lactoylglutathione lyase family enzyme